MIPYKWPLATAIPQSPAVRREIAKALFALVDDEDEQMRQRRAEIASIRQGLAEIAHDIAKFRRDAPVLISSELRKYGYNPEEPRVPKGSLGPGRWTDDGTQFAAAETNDAASVLRPRGGHHFVPRAIYEDLPREPETRKIFDDARIGTLEAARHGWSPEHAAYNQAVAEALKQFLIKNGIEPEEMTPDQAQQFVYEIIGSHDARIRDLHLKFYRCEVLYYIIHQLFLIGPSRH